MAEEEYYWQDAVRDLQAAGLEAELRAYGFRLTHQDAAGSYVGECGAEHDWSISLPLRIVDKDLRWFFRYSVRERADFIKSSFQLVKDQQAPSLIAAMEVLNRDYDMEDMKNRLQELRKTHGCRF